MHIMPAALTENQNKFLLFYAIDGMEGALKKAKVKEETVRNWMRNGEFLSLMNSMRDSYLAMASLHLKKSSLELVQTLTDLLLTKDNGISAKDRAGLIIKAMEMIRTFTMEKDVMDLLSQSEAAMKSHSKYEGVEVNVEEIR